MQDEQYYFIKSYRGQEIVAIRDSQGSEGTRQIEEI